MADFFGGLRSGIQFPQVVMNQGPLPGAGGLPQPLHDTADARINYGSSLLGDLTPYAYGEPGYLSSQNAYLNIPHKIQKIVPVVYLPEAKVGAKEFFDLSHPVDDGDLAFVLRLDRSSVFCTGLKNGDMRRAGLGTAIDPLINLCTLNYILSGLQLGIDGNPGQGNLWTELFYNLDKQWFGKPTGMDSRDYEKRPIGLDDVIHVVRDCIRPFGITRGSEKQGGQDEATISPATWPVSFVVSLTIDGKESNVLNIWHYHELHAGDDLVLRLRLMPLRPYTLNHYYKGVKRQNWDLRNRFVWQLVPDLFHMDMPTKSMVDEAERIFRTLGSMQTDNGFVSRPLLRIRTRLDSDCGETEKGFGEISSVYPWQNLGFWFIGRSQIQTGKYGVEEYWHNDLANTLKTNHLDITFQPTFAQLPFLINREQGTGRKLLRLGAGADAAKKKGSSTVAASEIWKPTLGLEKLCSAKDGRSLSESRNQRRKLAHLPDSAPRVSGSLAVGGGGDSANGGLIPVPSLASAGRAVEEVRQPAPPVEQEQHTVAPAPGAAHVGVAIPEEEPEWLGRLEFTDSEPAQAPEEQLLPGLGASAQTGASGGSRRTGKSVGGKRGRPIGGSLLKPDGTSESSMVGML